MPAFVMAFIWISTLDLRNVSLLDHISSNMHRSLLVLRGMFTNRFCPTQNEGRTALAIAAEDGDAECVRFLLQAGADKDDWSYVRSGEFCVHYVHSCVWKTLVQ